MGPLTFENLLDEFQVSFQKFLTDIQGNGVEQQCPIQGKKNKVMEYPFAISIN